jgi:hypothetical protein
MTGGLREVVDLRLGFVVQAGVDAHRDTPEKAGKTVYDEAYCEVNRA